APARMSQALIIRHAGQLLTLRGPAEPRRGRNLQDVGLISNGSVLIRDGAIEAAGAADEIERLPLARNAEEMDARGRVVMPGFVDGQPLDIVPTYLGAHVVPPEYAGGPDAYVDWICAEMLPRIRRQRLASFADIYCDRGAFTLEQSRRYLLAAKQLGFGLKLHAEQFTHSGATEIAVELGAVSADHLEQADANDAALLARSQTIATLLPGSVFHLGPDRYPPAPMLIEAGAAVALATDCNPGTSPSCSMPMIVSLACAQMRMSPAEALDRKSVV